MSMDPSLTMSNDELNAHWREHDRLKRRSKVAIEKYGRASEAAQLRSDVKALSRLLSRERLLRLFSESSYSDEVREAVIAALARKEIGNRYERDLPRKEYHAAEVHRVRLDRLQKLSLPIGSYLGARLSNALLNSGIEFVGDLARCSFQDLLQVNGLGRLNIQEIILKLMDAGLYLNTDVSDWERPAAPTPHVQT